MNYVNAKCTVKYCIIVFCFRGNNTRETKLIETPTCSNKTYLPAAVIDSEFHIAIICVLFQQKEKLDRILVKSLKGFLIYFFKIQTTPKMAKPQ